jgi:hypothetical protein
MNINLAPASGYGWAHMQMWRRNAPAGAEANVDSVALAARLKLCPVTKLPRIPAEASSSATCKADIGSVGILRGLETPSPTDVNSPQPVNALLTDVGFSAT